MLNCQKEEVQFETQQESEYHFKKLSLDEVLEKEGIDNSIPLIESYFDINKSLGTNRSA